MSSARTVLGLAVLLVTMGCSSGGGGTSVSGNGSCSQMSGGMLVTCTDYGTGFSASEAMQICSSTMDVYSADSCPSANRVGRCEITDSGHGASAGESVSSYPPETAADAMSACTMENGVMGVTTQWVAQ